jgi:hypothetical protein
LTVDEIGHEQPRSEERLGSAIREPVRRQLAADVAEFLARGGRIEEVPINRRADPPRRADGDYGRGAI